MDLHLYSDFLVYWLLEALCSTCHIHLFTHTFVHCWQEAAMQGASLLIGKRYSTSWPKHSTIHLCSIIPFSVVPKATSTSSRGICGSNPQISGWTALPPAPQPFWYLSQLQQMHLFSHSWTNIHSSKRTRNKTLLLLSQRLKINTVEEVWAKTCRCFYLLWPSSICIHLLHAKYKFPCLCFSVISTCWLLLVLLYVLLSAW